MGIGLAFFLMAPYYLHLTIYKTPSDALIVSAFLSLGPCGQGRYALLKLSTSLWDITHASGQALATDKVMTIGQAEAMVVSIYVSIVSALLVWNLDLVWLVLAVAILFNLWLVWELKFNLSCWGSTFPIGVFASATCQLGREIDSAGFGVLGTVLSVVVTLLWLSVSSLTLWKAVKNEIFFSPCLAEVDGEPLKELPISRQYA